MPWHDRIANDNGSEGWHVHLHWLEAHQTLIVSCLRSYPDGRIWDQQRTEYKALTLAEALDVACASVSTYAYPQLSLFDL